MHIFVYVCARRDRCWWERERFCVITGLIVCMTTSITGLTDAVNEPYWGGTGPVLQLKQLVKLTELSTFPIVPVAPYGQDQKLSSEVSHIHRSLADSSES